MQSHLLGVYPIAFIGSLSSTTSFCSTAVLFLQIAQLRLNFLIKNLSSFETTALLAQRSDFTWWAKTAPSKETSLICELIRGHLLFKQGVLRRWSQPLTGHIWQFIFYLPVLQHQKLKGLSTVLLSPDSHHHSPLKPSVPSLSAQRMTLKHLVPLPNCTWEPCTHEPNDDFPSPLLCLHSTCQPGSSWEMKAQPVLPSDLRSVGCTKPDAGPCSYCSQRKATKSYSLFDPPSTWFSIRSQCQLLPVKRWENQELLKKCQNTCSDFSGEKQQLQEKQVGFFIFKI